MPIYMEYEGIKGSVTAEGHEGWIELLSCQVGFNRHVSNPHTPHVTREATVPALSEVVVTKDLDCASTALVKESLSGNGKKVKIVYYRTSKDRPEVCLQLELENVLVANYCFQGQGESGQNQPEESLSLNFTKITYVTVLRDAEDAAGKPSSTTWDLATGKGA